jgi:SAM-dependent methyltransferase
LPRRKKPKRIARGSGRRAGLRFDADFGVTTEATIFLGELDPDALGQSLEYATHYDATPIADFERLIEMTTIEPEEATFVDLGCGLGRVVLLAARLPFRQVVGVEFSPALCEVARENVQRFGAAQRRCRDVRIVGDDAKDYALPRGPLVVFMFNPFHGPVMESVVRRLAQHPAELNVIYHTPLERRQFDDDPAFEVVADHPWACVYRNKRSAGPRPASVLRS